MTCQEIRDLLDDFCDGDLGASRRAAVEAHLAICANCRAEVDELRELIRESAALRRDVFPEQDLWPAVEARIATESAKVHRGPWFSVSRIGLAAAAVVIAVLGLTLARQAQQGAPGAMLPAGGPVEARQSGLTPDLALASEEARVRGGLMQVREDLLRSIAERRADMDPETRSLVDQNLEIIDRAIGEIYRSLEENPDNHELELLLAATHQREVEFLRQINLL